MPNRKRLNINENSAASNELPLRKNLPRKCKENQPCYAIDMIMDDFEKEEDEEEEAEEKGKVSENHSHTLTKRTDNPLIRNPQKPQENNQELDLHSIISWLIYMNVVKFEQPIYYKRQITQQGQVQISYYGEGNLTPNGIICWCCRYLFPVSQFAAHRGYSIQDENVYKHLYVKETTLSLLTCMVEAWNRHSVPARAGYHHAIRRPTVSDDHDDSCLICADGGALLCCENCPSTYHFQCVGLKGEPPGEWLCPYCSCKYCNGDASLGMSLTCSQCLKKYHWQCSRANNPIPQCPQLAELTPFCGMRCLRIYLELERRVGKDNPITPPNSSIKNVARLIPLIPILPDPSRDFAQLILQGFSWKLVRTMDLHLPRQYTPSLNLRATCNTMIALSAKLMEDSFNDIIDRQTRINTIQSAVYSCGSNFTRTNFSRFYTAILEHHGMIVSVAAIRVPTPEIAEIPFITTTKRYRNLGMCRLLLQCIEKEFSQLGVQRLVIPSAEVMVEGWKNKFGFKELDEYMEREIMILNTLMFPKTTRLQKMIGTTRLNLNLTPPQE